MYMRATGCHKFVLLKFGVKHLAPLPALRIFMSSLSFLHTKTGSVNVTRRSSYSIVPPDLVSLKSKLTNFSNSLP